MGTDSQIVIVGTGWHGNDGIEGYYASKRYNHDRPAYILCRDGHIEPTPIGRGQTLAIENVGAVVQHNGQWFPALPDSDGRYGRIAGADPIRVPYEFCSCKPYHGCQHYEYVTDKQLSSLRDVLRIWIAEYRIQYPYDNQLGAVCPRAKAGKSGIFFASSFDPSRSDIHPQREILDIIKAYAS